MQFSGLNCVSMLYILLCFKDALSFVLNKQNKGNHHKLLLVSFDGLRWDYVDRAEDMGAFQYLNENGVKAKYMQSAFPTQTIPNHFTIATGLYIESHGVVHNCYYNRYGGKPTPYYGTLRINEWWDNGAEPIWITAVNQGLKSGGYMFPGSYSNISGVGATMKILDTLATPRKESDWRNRIDGTMEWFTTNDLDMVALYFEQPDADSHHFGADSERVFSHALPLLNRTITYLLQKVKDYGLADNLNIIFTSDHGFQSIDTSVGGDDAISLARYVDLHDIDFMFPYGPLALVEPVPGKVDQVAAQLAKGNPHMKVYLKEDIPERFNYKNNDRITSIVVVAEPGYDTYLIFPGFHFIRGQHGYDNTLESMRATYYSIGPSFKKGMTVEGFENVNIYPLMCHLLGLTPAPNNGSLDVLFETLVES